ncbi:serine--tRNA ligase [Bradyrhizobium sp. 2S1]|uniref:serine--tRNA ligase n=1 Tax=Bradyrhizobium sp. 2S1 TaxID=1404429 RepID=UPI00140B996A|nr:serine--tRNA ligase [Bradyrhizobium sp. 2S1]MCK7669894.1 serine--tRNA ligase [Bradyrhizobium sp. 2S1]
MHDIKAIRENPTAFDAALQRRGIAPEAERLSSIEGRRLAINRVLDGWRTRRKEASDKIHQAIKAKAEGEVQKLRAEVADSKTSIATLEKEQREVEKELKDALAAIPNLPLPAPEVPDGFDEHSNVLSHRYGDFPQFRETTGASYRARSHDELGARLGYMDFEAAAKLSGARFVVLKKGLARLERAIGQFMLDLHTEKHGYVEVDPPLMVRDDAMFGTGQLPKFRDDQFGTKRPVDISDLAEKVASNYSVGSSSMDALLAKSIIEKFLNDGISTDDELFRSVDGVERLRFMNYIWESLQDVWKQLKGDQINLWLIPTAEVPLTNLVRDSILDVKELPLRLTALTPCFRAEAGAAGRDTRGMIRQHQFKKVELVSITTPETSKEEHERMLSCAEEVLRKLELHYRVMTLCAGDMGFSAQKTYDIEVWMPGQGEGGAYREISSCSLCGDFQARRMDARYRAPEGKPRFVHTLNGSGTAVGRALIAVMESYQQEDGSIAIPKVLQPYMGDLEKIEPEK